MRTSSLAFAFALLLFAAGGAMAAETVCTLVVEAESGEAIVAEGDCDRRTSPASTFKIAISLMGFDSGILISPSAPELPFREGYIDVRPEWRRAAIPAGWMRDSVIWYSQQVTTQLGEDRYRAYIDGFAYGNRDASGEPGKANGLTHAWLSASLQISPAEQVAFLRRMVNGALPVDAAAVANTAAIMDYGIQSGGWHLYGKTGAGLNRDADGALVRGKPFGWFVGWAQRGDRTIVFARLRQESERPATPPGFTARDALIEDLFADDGPLVR